MSSGVDTREFYDGFWPDNIPDIGETRQHLHSIIPSGDYPLVLDAGCGSGVFSLALSEVGEDVVAFDASLRSIRTGMALSSSELRDNIFFSNGDLLSLPFRDCVFDLILCWGVAHHTKNPHKTIEGLVRVLRPNGVLVLAVYRRTFLTPMHELVRAIMLRLPSPASSLLIKVISACVGLASPLMGLTESRKGQTIESKVRDWYLVPEKHFFSIEEIKEIFTKLGLSFTLIDKATGRFTSTSNIIISGVKK